MDCLAMKSKTLELSDATRNAAPDASVSSLLATRSVYATPMRGKIQEIIVRSLVTQVISRYVTSQRWSCWPSLSCMDSAEQKYRNFRELGSFSKLFGIGSTVSVCL